MIGKAIGAAFSASIALAVLMPFMQKNTHAVVDDPLPSMAEQQAATRAARNVFDWQIVFHRAPSFASNSSTDANLVTRGSNRADNASLEKAELFTTVHLVLDELKRGGWTFRLTIAPTSREPPV